MSLNTSIRRVAWLSVTGAALLVCFVALPNEAAGRSGSVATVELVPLSAAGPGDTTTELPAPLDRADLGESFVVEVWAQTDDSRGLSSVSMTIQFDPAVATVSGVTHTMLFSELVRGDVDNAAGLVMGLSGSHLSPCDDQVGVAPLWARVAILEMQATGFGLLVVESVESGFPALGTAVCGVGDLSPSQVAYGFTTLTVCLTADVECDGDVDLVDYAAFPACLSGPDLPHDAGCDRFDADANGHIDLADTSALMSLFTGAQ